MDTYKPNCAHNELLELAKQEFADFDPSIPSLSPCFYLGYTMKSNSKNE